MKTNIQKAGLAIILTIAWSGAKAVSLTTLLWNKLTGKSTTVTAAKSGAQVVQGTPLQITQAANAKLTLDQQISAINTSLGSRQLSLSQSATLLTQAVGVVENALQSGVIASDKMISDYKKQLASYKSQLDSAEKQLQTEGGQAVLNTIKKNSDSQATLPIDSLVSDAKTKTSTGSTESAQAQIESLNKAIGALSGAINNGQVNKAQYKNTLKDLTTSKTSLAKSIKLAAVNNGVVIPKSQVQSQAQQYSVNSTNRLDPNNSPAAAKKGIIQAAGAGILGAGASPVKNVSEVPGSLATSGDVEASKLAAAKKAAAEAAAREATAIKNAGRNVEVVGTPLNATGHALGKAGAASAA